MNITDILRSVEPRNFLLARNEYVYPSVGLTGTSQQFSPKSFASHFAMESYFNNLLFSEDIHEVVFGYLNIVYWGHVSGAEYRKLGTRALKKVEQARDGYEYSKAKAPIRVRGIVDLGDVHTARIIRTSAQHIQNSQYGRAVLHLTELPGLGFAFASKLCAFLSPQTCGVIDSVIVQRYPEFEFSVTSNKGYVVTTQANARLYEQYCNALSAHATLLNSESNTNRWKDLDGSMHTWRAVDVERAIYQLKR